MSTNKAQRAVIYARISRDQQGQGLGVERQEDLCRKLAATLGVEVGRVYTDNDISAYSGRRRPAYEQMLADIEAGRVDVVLTNHSDRLMRRTRELERYIDICRPRGVVTHQVTAGLLDLSSATGMAVAKTVAAWSQHESDIKGERVAAQKAQAARAGKYLGGRIPYGWHVADSGAVEVEPVAGDLIRTGTRAIIAGRSLIGITRDWADSGAVSLSGTRMNTTQVRRVLLRPRNAGLMTFHGEIVSDKWPAIVTLEEFRKCEAILTDTSRPRQSEAKYRYLLSGIAACHCGLPMTGFGVEARRSYRCSIHQQGGRYIRGHANRAMGPLDDYVTGVTAEYLNREDVRQALIARMQRLEADSRPFHGQDVSELVDRKHALARLFAQGAITESQLVEGSREIETKIGQLETMAEANGGSRAVSGLVLSDDPGAAFLAADIDVQRESIRALFEVQVNRTGPNRGAFDPASVTIRPKTMDS